MVNIKDPKFMTNKSPNVTISINDRTIEVPTNDAKAFELNKSLLNPNEFKRFAEDPMAYASRYDIKIEKELSADISTALKGFDSLEQAKQVMGELRPNDVALTFVAVLHPYVAIIDFKIALIV
jgi:hypothetical protein